MRQYVNFGKFTLFVEYLVHELTTEFLASSLNGVLKALKLPALAIGQVIYPSQLSTALLVSTLHRFSHRTLRKKRGRTNVKHVLLVHGMRAPRTYTLKDC